MKGLGFLVKLVAPLAHGDEALGLCKRKKKKKPILCVRLGLVTLLTLILDSIITRLLMLPECGGTEDMMRRVLSHSHVSIAALLSPKKVQKAPMGSVLTYVCSHGGDGTVLGGPWSAGGHV